MAATDSTGIDPSTDTVVTPKLIEQQELCMEMTKRARQAAADAADLIAEIGYYGIISDAQRDNIQKKAGVFYAAQKWFIDYSTTQHMFVVKNEYTWAVNTGGRDALIKNPTTMQLPVSISLAIALSLTHYCRLLCLCALEGYSEFKRTGADQPCPRIMLDERIDGNLLGLGWAQMEQLALVSSNADERQRGLKTIGSIETFVNHIRRVWRGLDPTKTPIEKIVQVVYAAMGRIILFPEDAFRSADSEMYTETMKPGEGYAYRAAPAFYADRWLILSSMLVRRTITQTWLKPFKQQQRQNEAVATNTNGATKKQQSSKYAWPDPKAANKIHQDDLLAIAWNIVVRGQKCRVPGMPAIPTKETLLAWAIGTADTPAVIEDVLRRVLAVAERVELMPGDAHLHRVYFPMEETRASTVLASLHGNEEVKRITERIGSSPAAILRDNDIDIVPMATACFLRVVTCTHTVHARTLQKYDEVCVFWDDTVEQDLGRAVFTHPVILQTHGVWIVTLEGKRTEPVPFSLALRIMLCMQALLEVKRRAQFPVICLIDVINAGAEKS